MKKFSLKTQFIINGVILILSVVWVIIGTQFITPDSSGAACFFGLTLPVLIGLAVIGMFLRLFWRMYKAKKQANTEETIK